MASPFDEVFDDAGFAQCVASGRALHKACLEKTKQDHATNYGRLTAALVQALKERDDARTRAEG